MRRKKVKRNRPSLAKLIPPPQKLIQSYDINFAETLKIRVTPFVLQNKYLNVYNRKYVIVL